MTETLEVDKNLLTKLQMSKYSQPTGKIRIHEQPLNEVCDLHSECRERHIWHADQLKLALHQCCADIKIWWSDLIRKISEVSESDPDPKSMLKT